MANSIAVETPQTKQAKFNFDFIGNRNIAFVISIVLIVVGIGSIFVRGGLNMGIDFAGGTLVEVRFSEVPPLEEIRNTVTAAGFRESVIQRLEDGHVVLIRVPLAPAEEEGQDQSAKILDALRGRMGQYTFELLQTNQVGPQVGSELRQSAQLAMLFALSGLVLYVSWRFESKIAIPVAIIGVLSIGFSSWEWLLASTYGIPILIVLALAAVLVACVVFDYHYALAAIIALIHDVLITVGALSLTNREITLPVIAALLALIGYSLNDTIVVFDRIRENLRLMGRQDMQRILNQSVNQMLTRTVLTSLTTLFVVAVLFVAGGHVINSFAFALLVGITVGTYSSIFVATPVLYIWNQRVKGGIFRKA